eukprot:2333177-Pyramimonas_sp.AAC.1
MTAFICPLTTKWSKNGTPQPMIPNESGRHPLRGEERRREAMTGNRTFVLAKRRRADRLASHGLSP